MRIGVLEILKVSSGRNLLQRQYAHYIIKQYASVMPQAVSVWCRELGHEVHYATYYGQQDPRSLLPRDLDIVFIATYTQASSLAYALARTFRHEEVVTVIGGHHAKSFPQDCLRFFDVVVLECDRTLIGELLADMPIGEIVTSGRTLEELPSVEARMPEIRKAFFVQGQPYLSSSVPLLSSIGCPYTCDFCIDARTRYSVLPADRLEADLRFVKENYPQLIVTFHDPNFAVRFDEVLSVIEKVGTRKGRRYYAIESSLSVLKQEERLARLRDSGCRYIAPGVESFGDYGQKSGLRSSESAHDRLEAVNSQLATIQNYIPGIQANYIFGLDTDAGDEPVELLKEIITRTPFVWSVINIPTPFGGTPLYERLLSEERILRTMPFHFYYKPFLTVRLNNYDPIAYYRKLVDLWRHVVSLPLTLRRVVKTPGAIRILHSMRTYHAFRLLRACQEVLERLETDSAFRNFHEGRTELVPDYYWQTIAEDLGPYSTLLSKEDLYPVPSQSLTAALAAH